LTARGVHGATGTSAAESLIGRLLIGVTYVSVGLLAIGVALMVADAISPLAGGPSLDLATLGAQVVAGEPAGFLWLGLLAVIAAPIGRVVAAAIAYARDGDSMMVAIALATLVVIAIGVGTALTATV
jgi:uncharacterized membrane protein